MKKTHSDLLEDYEMVVQINQPQPEEGTWQEAFSAGFENYGFLVEGGALYHRRYHRENGVIKDRKQFDKIHIADFTYYDLDDLNMEGVEDSPAMCPFVDPMIGFCALNFTWNLKEDICSTLIYCMIYYSRGIISGETEDAEVHFPCVTHNYQSIWLGKYGLGDGDILLDREEANYIMYIIEEIRAKLRSRGYDAGIYTIGTGHNPLRYDSFIKWDSSTPENWRHLNDMPTLTEDEIPSEIFSEEIRLWTLNHDEDYIEKVVMHIPEPHVMWT